MPRPSTVAPVGVRVLHSQLEENAIPFDTLIAGKQPEHRVATARAHEIALDAKVKRPSGNLWLRRFVPRAAGLPKEAMGSGAASDEHSVEEQPEQASGSENRAREHGKRGEAKDGSLPPLVKSSKQHEMGRLRLGGERPRAQHTRQQQRDGHAVGAGSVEEAEQVGFVIVKADGVVGPDVPVLVAENAQPELARMMRQVRLEGATLSTEAKRPVELLLYGLEDVVILGEAARERSARLLNIAAEAQEQASFSSAPSAGGAKKRRKAGKQAKAAS